MAQTRRNAKIEAELKSDGYYHLRRAGETRVLGSGSANTVLANAGWPTGAEERRLLWQYGKPIGR